MTPTCHGRPMLYLGVYGQFRKYECITCNQVEMVAR